MSRYCTGCGVALQSEREDLDGYVVDLEMPMCRRCYQIKHYGKDVLSHYQKDDFYEMIKGISYKKRIVYISSLLTLDLEDLDMFKHVILVLTKRDILPKSVKDEKIINYVKKRYPVKDVFIVSAYKNYNLDVLYNNLLKKREDVYFVGKTNSGKSSLINALRRNYTDCDSEITVSGYPATTLGFIKKKMGDIMIVDTPGLVDANSILNNKNASLTKLLNVVEEIRPVTIQISSSGSIMLGDLFRIDYNGDLNSLTIYTSNRLKVKRISKKNKIMLDKQYLDFSMKYREDLVIGDVGFIKFVKGEQIRVYFDDNVHFWTRDNLI